MVKVGLIGINGFGRSHVRTVLKLIKKGRIECIAFADVKVDTEDEQYNELVGLGAKYYEDYNEMLDKHSELDFVAIATPIALHKPMAVNALNKDFNVFLEKPPAVTIQDLDEIIDASRKSGRLCGVDFQNTSGKAFKLLIEKIQAGELGDIQRVVGVGMWKRTQDYYERTSWAGKLMHNEHYVLDGTINNPLAHLLNNCLIVAGGGYAEKATPERVQAELYKGHDIESEDTACVRINAENGVEIMFYTTLCNSINDVPYIRVYGSRGQIYWNYRNTLEIAFNDGRKDSFTFKEEDLYENMFLNFIDAIEDKNLRLNSSIHDCRSFVLASNGAFESCGRTIKIPDENLIIENEGETISTYIKDIEKIFERATKEYKLFSELPIEWAVKTKPFSTKGYTSFELFRK